MAREMGTDGLKLLRIWSLKKRSRREVITTRRLSSSFTSRNTCLTYDRFLLLTDNNLTILQDDVLKLAERTEDIRRVRRDQFMQSQRELEQEECKVSASKTADGSDVSAYGQGRQLKSFKIKKDLVNVEVMAFVEQRRYRRENAGDYICQRLDRCITPSNLPTAVT